MTPPLGVKPFEDLAPNIIEKIEVVYLTVTSDSSDSIYLIAS
jgi:hypothetical protein